MKSKYVLAGSIFGLLLLVLCYLFIYSEPEIDKNKQTEKYPKDEDDNDIKLNKEMEKRYTFYKENIKKYRLGLPRDMYKNLNNRIHDAPDPNGIYKSTLPKGCNALYFKPEETDDDICDLMNTQNIKTVATGRLRY